MLSLKKICACCFVSNENSRSDSPSKDESSINNNDVTHQIENSSLSIKKTQIKTCKIIVKLEVLESQSIEVGTVLCIDSEGLQGGKRQKDGIVYVGSNEEFNDILISEKEKGIGGKHFMIKYDSSFKNSFAIRDQGEGMGTFIRIDKRLYLHSNNIISFGDSHMIILTDHSDNSRITLKFIDGPRKDQSHIFHLNDSPITIGRMADCSIRFDDSSLSRYHCLISYESSWLIKDGDGSKPSTNGTWLYCEDFAELYSGMVFKAAETLFKVELDSFN